MRFFAVLAVLAALLFSAKSARACTNAILRDQHPFQTLHSAELELEDGNWEDARRLAQSVRMEPTSPPSAGERAHLRAMRVVALSFVRDPNAHPPDIAWAVENLHEQAASRNEPTVIADYGEALARVERWDDANAQLAPLFTKDLIGSPWALSALERTARHRGDAQTADAAHDRCETMTGKSPVCRGEPPPQPLLRVRGDMYTYVAVGIFVAIAFYRRIRRAWPWRTYGEKLYAAGVLATAVLAFALAPHWPISAVALTAVALASLAWAQRTVYLRAVARGRIPGLSLRVEENGTRVIERAPGAETPYREAARGGVIFTIPRSRVVPMLAVAFLATVALLFLFATLTLRG